ncbi:hypothetical protein [Sphingomonas faeni]|uniref:hypothetical protein n=1 Tax=Sphingomonas faeni TaxID=185950 RepID=UPI0033567024
MKVVGYRTLQPIGEDTVLVDRGKIRTKLTRTLLPINAPNLKTPRAKIESGATRGKIALEGF